jgi:hypothetical protein
VLDSEVLYPDIHVFHHHCCHTQQSVFCVHYYAKALNQYYDSLERLSPYKDGRLKEKMRTVTIKALEKFWFITQMPMDEENKTIVALAQVSTFF